MQAADHVNEDRLQSGQFNRKRNFTKSEDENTTKIGMDNHL
jgi:hypothetical protein